MEVDHDWTDEAFVELRVVHKGQEEGRHEEEDVNKEIHVTHPHWEPGTNKHLQKK